MDSAATRPPGMTDLVRLCAALNAAGARYMVVGGFAVNYYGFARATEDIDLLVDQAPQNVQRIKQGLAVLPDNAASELADTDVAEFTVVRILDEITVDLIARVGQVTFENAGSVQAIVDGVTIPVADLDTLIATKQGIRERDRRDLAFLLRVKRAR